MTALPDHSEEAYLPVQRLLCAVIGELVLEVKDLRDPSLQRRLPQLRRLVQAVARSVVVQQELKSIVLQMCVSILIEHSV